MKVGQIASQYKDIFPPEVARAISKLQRQAPPMPFKEIQSQVEKELGKSLQDLFQQFDEQPLPQPRSDRCIKRRYPMASRLWSRCNIREWKKPVKVT